MRVWLREWLCGELECEAQRLSTLAIKQKAEIGYLKVAVDSLTTEVGELRQALDAAKVAAPPPPAGMRKARTWSEFKSAAEHRPPERPIP